MKMKFGNRGESGSESVSSLAIMGLLPAHISKISEGCIVFQGNNVAKLNCKTSAEIAMIQEPMSSLNPSLKCGKCRKFITTHKCQETKAETLLFKN
jgi:peptide/nickel transport system ATP-binding protein